MIHGGSTCFAHNIASALPFVEMCMDVPEREHSMVLADGERLVAFVCAVSEPFFLLEVLVLRLTFRSYRASH
jgi:hypothetical protein